MIALKKYSSPQGVPESKNVHAQDCNLPGITTVYPFSGNNWSHFHFFFFLILFSLQKLLLFSNRKTVIILKKSPLDSVEQCRIKLFKPTCSLHVPFLTIKRRTMNRSIIIISMQKQYAQRATYIISYIIWSNFVSEENKTQQKQAVSWSTELMSLCLFWLRCFCLLPSIPAPHASLVIWPLRSSCWDPSRRGNQALYSSGWWDNRQQV